MPLPSHSRSAISFPEFQNQTEITSPEDKQKPPHSCFLKNGAALGAIFRTSMRAAGLRVGPAHRACEVCWAFSAVAS